MAAVSDRVGCALLLVLAHMLLLAVRSAEPTQCVDSAQLHQGEEASLLQLQRSSGAASTPSRNGSGHVLVEEAVVLQNYAADAAAVLRYAPTWLGCYRRAQSDSQDPAFYMDLSCRASRKPQSPCRSGLPFYRLPLLPSQTYLDCCAFCTTKGLDICGLAASSGDVASGTECRCGASTRNVAAWRRQPPRPELLPPASDVLDRSDPDCSVMVWNFGGDLEEGEVPEVLLAINDADERYQNTVIDPGTSSTQSTTRDSMTTTPPAASALKESNLTQLGESSASLLQLTAPLEMHAGKFSRAVSLLASSGLCKDANDTGYNLGPENPASCAQLTRFCPLMVEVKSVCPVTCEVCQADANGAATWLPCYPHACGPGGGPWQTKATDGLVYINYWFDVGVDDTRKATFKAAAGEWAARTCVRMVESTVKPRLLVGVFDPDACNSVVGYPGDGQEAKLNMGWCNSLKNKGSVMHELGHVFGMNHEQNRPDAAATYQTPSGAVGPFLTIYWMNIGSDWIDQYTPDERSYIGSKSTGYVNYNYNSIMHYSRQVSPVNFDTIDPKYNSIVGQRQFLSDGDVHQVMDLYQCAKNSGSTTAKPTTTTTTTTATTRAPLAVLGNWSTGDWGPCFRLTSQVKCNRTRSLSCVGPRGIVLPATSCKAKSVPSTTEFCTCISCSDVKEPRFTLNREKTNCSQLATYCNDPTYGSEVMKDCPETCGACSTGACMDKNPTRFMLGSVRATCSQLTGYCSDPSWKLDIQQDCPLTCQVCGCRDKLPTRFSLDGQPATCAALKQKGYCNNLDWMTQVRIDCPRTCTDCKLDLDDHNTVYPMLIMPKPRILS